MVARSLPRRRHRSRRGPDPVDHRRRATICGVHRPSTTRRALLSRGARRRRGRSLRSGWRRAAPAPASAPRPPLTFDQAKAAGQERRLGPELRHHHRQGRGAERLRAAVRRSRGRAATTAAPRPGRHQGHHHRRALPGPARPPAAGVLREHRERREPGQGARHRPGVRRLLLRALRAVRAQDQARHRSRRAARPTTTVAAKADAIKVATEMHAFASFGGPGQTDRVRGRARRARACCASATASSPSRSRSSSSTRRTSGRRSPSPEQASEHWAAFVGTQLAKGKGRARRLDGSHDEDARVRRRPLRRRRGHVPPKREALRGAPAHVPA